MSSDTQRVFELLKNVCKKIAKTQEFANITQNNVTRYDAVSKKFCNDFRIFSSDSNREKPIALSLW